MIYLFSFMMSLIGVLLSVAFFTLLERKIMGLAHYRLGPNKLILMGISQPLSDAAKLLTKETPKFLFNKKLMYSLAPLVAMLIMMILWGMYNYAFTMISKPSLSVLVILLLMSLSPFIFILSSWGSNSKFSLMGGYRTISQTISYEVCFIIVILILAFLQGSLDMKNFSNTQEHMWYSMMFPLLFIMWLVLCMAESNRTPFDHSESESELVSGFNLEYGGGLFALIFIAEYGMIMFISFFTAALFLGKGGLLLKTFSLCLLFVWTRSTFPRMRYDKLMMLCWKICLPYTIGALTLSMCF